MIERGGFNEQFSECNSNEMLPPYFFDYPNVSDEK